MMTVFIRRGDGTLVTDAAHANIAAALKDPKAVFWLDMDKPTEEDYGILDDIFGFHPLAIEDTIGYNQRPKIESYRHASTGCDEGYFYMVIHGPDLDSFREKLRTKELDMFVSERYLLTIHEEQHKSVNDVLLRARNDPLRLLGQGIDMLLHNILDHVVDNYMPILDYMQEELDELEDEAINNPTPDLLARISGKKRELLNMRRVIGPQREVLAQLTRGDVPFIREHTRVYLRDVQDHLMRAVETLELYRDLILGARDIYLSSLSNNLNQIMKTLTIISVIALPMTVVTSFFGMNFDDLPGIHSHKAFWMAMTIMMSLVAVLLVVFKKRKWL